jgi:hypothetical protein
VASEIRYWAVLLHAKWAQRGDAGIFLPIVDLSIEAGEIGQCHAMGTVPL